VKTIGERVDVLEKKVLKLEGGNLIREEPMGKEERVSKPYKSTLSKE
jgi:hypothetical protein